MSQIISVDATTGEFILPCFGFEADAFAVGLAFNTTGLEIQICTNAGGFHRYVVGAAITNNVAPANNTEVGFAQLDGTNGWFVKLQAHTSIFSTLDIEAGESIGMIGMSATGFASVVGTLVFAKPIATDVDGRVNANLTQIGGVTQSLLDLKHFADEGYNPATSKVLGVVLVDTTTTNSDMRGTDNAALAVSLAEFGSGVFF